MRTLVAFSGGLDSTYILWKLLKESDKQITAMFLDTRYMINCNLGQAPVEEQSVYLEVAIERIVSYLQNIRHFEYVKKNVYSFLPDERLCVHFARYAANQINLGNYDEAMHGEQSRRSGRLAYAATVAFSQIADISKFTCPLRPTIWNKWTSHQLQELPIELSNLTISCQMPRVSVDGNINQCGTCAKCVRGSFVGLKLSEGIDADAIIELWENQPEYVRETARKLNVLSTNTLRNYPTLWPESP
jgi:hypothetical protein